MCWNLRYNPVIFGITLTQLAIYAKGFAPFYICTPYGS
jgi:hypothetical protein